MCFLNDLFLGDESDLTKWAKDQFGFTFTRPQSFYKTVTEDYYIKRLKTTGASRHTHLKCYIYIMLKLGLLVLLKILSCFLFLQHRFVFMDIAIGEEAVGRLTFEVWILSYTFQMCI